jgi:hypothetical protein
MAPTIKLIDFSLSLRDRFTARKITSGYMHTPPDAAAPERGFYFNNGKPLETATGYRLRASNANDHIEFCCAYSKVSGYHMTTEPDCDSVCMPFVLRLPGARGFLAACGEGAGMWGVAEVARYDNLRDAAVAAHNYAQRVAEKARETYAREHEDIDFEVSISHVDTCLPGYLQDHHSRDGETLIAVLVDGSSTWKDVQDGFESDWSNYEIYPAPSDPTALYEAIDRAIAAYFEQWPATDLFDSSLDSPPSDDPDSDEYDSAVEDMEETECGGNEAEIAQRRYNAMRDAQREFEDQESCYAYFVITWTLPESD